jgi:hypothetical protein
LHVLSYTQEQEHIKNIFMRSCALLRKRVEWKERDFLCMI